MDLVNVSAVVRALSGPKRTEKWAGPIAEAMAAYGIDTPTRAAAFLAQIAHESGSFNYTREIWGPTEAQKRYERDFNAAWPPTKEDPRNRKAFDLGNSEKGDGRKFCGHGLIQTTGRKNHKRASDMLRQDFIADPGLLEEPKWAALSAALFWHDNGLNTLADNDEFEQLTRRINGGLTHWANRVEKWKIAKKVLCV